MKEKIIEILEHYFLSREMIQISGSPQKHFEFIEKIANEIISIQPLISDDEIIEFADKSGFLNPEFITRFALLRAGFIDGARWMRDKMKIIK